MYFCHQLLIVIIIGAASAHEHCLHHHGTHGHHSGPHHPRYRPGYLGGLSEIHEAAFQNLAQDVKDLDEKVQNFCNRHNNGNTGVTVEKTRYVLSTPLTGYVEGDLKIQVKGRVLFVGATNANEKYTEIRVLPTFADAAKATYNLEEGVLEVAFPVKSQSSCNIDYSDNIITVPKFNLFQSGSLVGPRHQ